MMYNQPMLPIVSENQCNLLISLAYTVFQQKLAKAAQMVTSAIDPRSMVDCFEMDPIITLLHEANASRQLIEQVNQATATSVTYPVSAQVNWIAVNNILKALEDTNRIVEAFKAVDDPTPNTWWYSRLHIYVSNENLTDLYILLGSLRAIVAPFQPIDPERFVRLD